MLSTRTYAAIAGAAVVAGLGVAGWLSLSPGGDLIAECGGGVATGAATIGGPFTLVDHTGATVTDADVVTGPTLIYFGYTFCPDVCPTDVAVMGQAADILAEGGRKVNTVFISVDPSRDTPKVLSDFVSVMHPEMRGLTGSEEQVAAAAKAYRVFYQKADGDDPEYYLMDHSAFTYLTAPETGFLNVFRHGDTPEAIAETTACFVDALAGS